MSPIGLAMLYSVVLISGCSSFNPPRYSEKHISPRIPNQWDNAKSYVNSNFSTQLLELVNNDELSVLVHDTLESNYDLRQTALRLRQADLIALQRNNYLQPSLSTNYQASRDTSSTISNSHKLSLDLSWELDVWGRLADKSRAASSRAKSAELDYLYARSSLAARVIQAWLDIQYRAAMINVEKQWIVSLLDTEEVITSQILDGSKEHADLDTARAATERVKAGLVARQQQQLAAIRSLNALRGNTSKDYRISSHALPTIPTPILKLPGEMVGSRPDLLSAYQSILAADTDTSVAYKELLPKITLTASLYRLGTYPDALSQTPSLWSLMGGVTAPIFNQNSIKTNAKVAALKAEDSYINYQKKLVSALTEVNIALDKEYYLTLQEQHYKDAKDYSNSSMKNYEYLYQEGTSDIIALLVAKQSVYQSTIQLLQTQQARFSNRVSLGLALGMGV
ncbi:TolC family protein [Vibrio mediterranei]|nr:TolC family protein [Vibrio mediterranei]